MKKILVFFLIGLMVFALGGGIKTVELWIDETLNNRIDVYNRYVLRNKSLAHAIAVANANPTKKYQFVINNPVPVTTNVTIPSNVTAVTFERNGYFNNTGTINMYSKIDALNDAFVFHGTGKVFPYVNNTISVKWWGALGDNTSNDSSEFQRAAAAMRNGMEFYIPEGVYILSSQVSFSGISHFKITGDYRATKLEMDGTMSYCIGIINNPLAYQRGAYISNLIFIATAANRIPSYNIRIEYTPEVKVENCVFINSSTEANLYMTWSWSSRIQDCIFRPRETAPDYGSPAIPARCGGAGLNLDQEMHETLVLHNRIRAGGASYAGIIVGSGENIEVLNNAIEGNTGPGLLVNNAGYVLRIIDNYFEGNVSADIKFADTANQSNITIAGNLIQGSPGIWFDKNDINGGIIENNIFNGCLIATRWDESNLLSKVSFRNNTMSNVATNYMVTARTDNLVYPANSIDIDNLDVGTKGTQNIDAVKVLGPMYVYEWSEYAGTGTANASTPTQSYLGRQLVVVSSNSGAYYVETAVPWDPSFKNQWFTIELPFLMNPKDTTRNQITMLMQDGVATNNITYYLGGATTNALHNMAYFKTTKKCSYLRCRIGVPTKQKVFIGNPVIRKGFHGTPGNLSTY